MPEEVLTQDLHSHLHFPRIFEFSLADDRIRQPGDAYVCYVFEGEAFGGEIVR